MAITLNSSTNRLTFNDNSFQKDLPIGVSPQTWQNVNSSRSFSTNYTNSTNMPIVVLISITAGNESNNGVQVLVDGVEIARVGKETGNNGGNQYYSCLVIVQPGSTYNVQVYGSTPGKDYWWELR